MRKPCANCPWRRDAEPGYWHPDHFRDIWRTCQDDGHSLMLCHKSSKDVDEPLVCQGWIRVLKTDAVGVRIALIQGRVTAEEMDDLDTADLYASFDEMMAANGIEPPPRNRYISPK